LIPLFNIVTAQKNTIAVLDGVRAWACLSVISYHLNRYAILSHIWTPAIGSFATGVILTGWSGVTLFFVLSGFLLFMPYAKSLLWDRPWPSARTFYLRRAFRILPGYYVALAALILLENRDYLQPARLKDLALFLTFFMDAPQTFQKINGPFWTLAIEAQFYMLLPLLALGFRSIVQRGTIRRRLSMLGLCLGGVITWGVASRYWGPYLLAHPEAIPLPRPLLNVGLFFLYGFAGKYLEDFAIGMLVSTCYILSQDTAVRHRLVEVMRRGSQWLWGLGIGCLFFMAVWTTFPVLSFLKPFLSAERPFCELGFAIGYGLCVAGLLFGPNELRRPLEWRPLRWIGLISYSLYIWHLPILLWFVGYVLPLIQRWNGVVVYGIFWLCVALVIIPVCYLLYRLVEQPWMNLGSKVTRRAG
jgi:peptidoglycan/LPS O-acetylase OafA/YrhL